MEIIEILGTVGMLKKFRVIRGHCTYFFLFLGFRPGDLLKIIKK
jgi:hypothetical protein